jgi:hypothetical protein
MSFACAVRCCTEEFPWPDAHARPYTRVSDGIRTGMRIVVLDPSGGRVLRSRPAETGSSTPHGTRLAGSAHEAVTATWEPRWAGTDDTCTTIGG